MFGAPDISELKISVSVYHTPNRIAVHSVTTRFNFRILFTVKLNFASARFQRPINQHRIPARRRTIEL